MRIAPGGSIYLFDMNNQDVRIYFDAHIAVDPPHSGELSDDIRPELSALEIHDIVRGAHMAVVAGCRQYDLWLAFFMQSVEGTK
jgi:hypothetical protein